MVSVPRTEVMEVKNNQLLSVLCHRTKNLYNRANYLYKQALQQGKTYSYYDLDKVVKMEECYKLLPAHTAQHTLKLLMRNWRAYYQARKERSIHPQRFCGPPRPPTYKPPKGERQFNVLECASLLAYAEASFGTPVHKVGSIRIATGETHFWTMNDILKERELERIKF